MSTVLSRVVASNPARSADETWTAISALLLRAGREADRRELAAVAGIASALIAERAPEAAAIVVTCDGPRTRIRCIYDEDATDGSDASEEPLVHDPLAGDWAVSLPCPADDLAWARGALARASSRVTARDMDEALGPSAAQATAREDARAMPIDATELLRP